MLEIGPLPHIYSINRSNREVQNYLRESETLINLYEESIGRVEREKINDSSLRILAAMLQNATVHKSEKSEFSNTTGDTIKITLNNYNLTKEEFSNAVECIQNVVPALLAEVRKNDHHRSTAGAIEATGADGSGPEYQGVTADKTMEGDPVDIIDLVPPEPSSLPIVSIADLYTRSLLECLAGYPLYEPQPLSEFSTQYLRNGINIGDVGFVRGDGTFDFLFNICSPQNALINPPELPISFSLKQSECLKATAMKPLPGGACFFPTCVTRTKSGKFICEGSNGAVLELPAGAIRDEAMNMRPLIQLAARYGVQWYEYTMNRGREIPNGALYLITSFTKCAQWGIAVFDRKCAPGQSLKFGKKKFLPFTKAKYQWNGPRVFPTKVSDLNQGDVPNQCVFLKGYKIMIRQDIFNNLCKDQNRRSDSPSTSQIGSSTITMTRQRATRIRGGAGPDPADGDLWSWTKIASSTAKSDRVVLYPNFNSSLVHPSDIINAELLSQNPNAKVALTHDDVWCNLLRDNFPKLNYAALINTARSLTIIVDEYECVSLVGISDSSNVLDHNSRLIQRTQTPALRRSLTMPHEDHVNVPAMTSLTLPRELVERILLLLETKSMLTCRLVNREFNEIFQSSTILQYFLACKAAVVIDNPRSLLSYGERLEALKKREDAWRTLKPVFEMTIQVNHKPSSLYDLSGGAYFLGDANQDDMHYCHLPSSSKDNPEWIKISAHGPGKFGTGILADFALAAHEHDLMVSVISSDTESETNRHSLDLVFLKFSTNEYHPLARRPRIHVQRSPEALPWVATRVVGDNLALVVHSADGSYPDALFIFDWKTGDKRLEHEATENAYSNLVFLSPELLLVPNIFLSNFEVWHIPPSKLKPPIQILSLNIPSVSSDYSLFDLRCRGEPNPFLHSMPYFPPRPFFSSPENSIIIAKLVFESLQDLQRVSYTLIMHRRALLDTIQKWTSASAEEQDLSTWLTNEVSVHEIVDTNDRSVRLEVWSELVSMEPHPRTTPRTDSLTFGIPLNSPTLLTSPDPGPSYISSGLPTTLSATAGQYDICVVKWGDWGPPISRWFKTNGAPWIICSAGQRYVFSEPHPRDERKSIVSVADFNPYNFRRDAGRVERVNKGKAKKEAKEKVELEILDHGEVFSEKVYMGLKCVVHHAPGEYDFDVVLMDEERLLGLKLDHEGREESIQVFSFG